MFRVVCGNSGALLATWAPKGGLYALETSQPWFDVVERKPPASTFRISAFHCPPFFIFNERANDSQVEADGVEAHILRAALGNGVEFSAVQRATTADPWRAVLEAVYGGRGDGAACSLWMWPEKQARVDFSLPWASLRTSFVAPRAQPLPPLRTALQPFSADATLALMAAAAITVALLIAATRHVGTRASARLDVCKYTLDVYRLLHLNSLPRLPTRSSPRCVLVAWCFFSQLLATSYSSTFTSVLTVQRYGPPIDSFRDLLQRGVFWGGHNQALQRQISVIDDPYIREFGARYREELTPQDKEARLREGRYAVFVKVINDYVTHTENLPADVRRSLRLMKETMAKYYISIALQKNSPYKSTLDRRMRYIHYSGLINYWMKHVIARLGHHYMRSFFVDRADSQHEMPQKLSLRAVEGAFFICTTGIIVASLVFLSEITYEKFCYCLQRYPNRPRYLYNLG